MDALESYLQERQRLFKASCDAWLTENKKDLQSWLNQQMAGQIAYAERQIELGQQKAIARFRQNMQNLAERKKENTSPLFARMLDRLEHSYKDRLEQDLAFTESLWKSHIEKCKLEMK